jgi:hypothetical protein
VSTKPTIPTVESPARRIVNFSKKLSLSPGLAHLSPSLCRELEDISGDTVKYLKARIESVEVLKTQAQKSARDLQKTENEIARLEGKEEKAESDFLRLTLLDRMRSDIASKAEASNKKAIDADDLLKLEIAGFQQPLAMALSINYTGAILAKAISAVAPFCEKQPPSNFANQLPSVQAAASPFQHVFNRHVTGVANANSLIALIHQAISDSSLKNA